MCKRKKRLAALFLSTERRPVDHVHLRDHVLAVGVLALQLAQPALGGGLAGVDGGQDDLHAVDDDGDGVHGFDSFHCPRCSLTVIKV